MCSGDRCSYCKEERPDCRLSLIKVGEAPRSQYRHYCNDNTKCIEDAKREQDV